jgi:thioredoxin reductase/ferredoxin
MEATVPLAIAAIALLLLLLGALIDDRRARARRLAAAPEERPLLHSINDDRCIGCEACVDVCPTEVLELVDHKARVVRFSDCVQCEQCANACPTTALVMYRQGGVPQTLTVPELDDHFQTGVPGQYLIGEVAGKPLVKNAANLGRAVIEHIANELAGLPRVGGDLLDVAIVGSGPGGLSAGLTCIKRGLSVVVLEKEHVISSTVSRYPKGKHFMAEPSHAVNRSYLPVFDASKEDLIAAWKRVVEHARLPIRLGEAVETVKRGDDGSFEIKTTVGTYRARKVVLATGLRGKPRLLAVPGANLEKVQSRLEDPAELGGQHVLVVGGGDSAVEAAASLVDVGATVTLSYRGDGFKRCKQGNQKRLAELSSAGRLSVLLESNVKEFTPDAVAIKLKDGRVVTLPNQQAFVLIGADTPVAWLEANHVRFVEREHLYALGSTEDAVLKVVPGAAECPRSPDEAIAVLDGAPLRPSHRRERAASHRPGAERSVVRRLRDELHRAAGELTGVFKNPLHDPPRPVRASTGAPASGRSPAGRTTGPQLIPATQLARPRPPTPAPRLFARPTTIRPRTSPGTMEHSETTVEMRSLPARLEARAAGAPRSTPRPRTELHPWAEDDEVVTSAPAYTPRVAARAAPTYASGPVTVIDAPAYAPAAPDLMVRRPAGGAAPAQVLRKRMAG